jgi:hypothetical protein
MQWSVRSVPGASTPPLGGDAVVRTGRGVPRRGRSRKPRSMHAAIAHARFEAAWQSILRGQRQASPAGER